MIQVDNKGVIPGPRTADGTDSVFTDLAVCSDGLVRRGRTPAADIDEMIDLACDHVVADLQHRARRLRTTREPFPANPYRLADELLDSGKLPFEPKNRDAARELLARLYRAALQRILVG
jgi:hypothetical protein